KLAKCVNRYLGKYSGATFVSLAKATVSYVVFEKKLKVCNLYNYKSILKKLRKVDAPNDVKRKWQRKINRLCNTSGKDPQCAKEVDMVCVREYAQRMRKDQNLCTNIPFKAQCLIEAYHGTCPASIIRRVSDIFPSEANKVLAKLCAAQAQDIQG
ncbi:hypothetical protein QZH41_015395, partial [Actinostola sp. cb2023]